MVMHTKRNRFCTLVCRDGSVTVFCMLKDMSVFTDFSLMCAYVIVFMIQPSTCDLLDTTLNVHMYHAKFCNDTLSL